MIEAREQEVLNRRAEALAKPLSHAPHLQTVAAFIVFMVSGTRYALETKFVLEVTRAGELLPVPGTRPHMLGLCSVRGEHLTAIDVSGWVGARMERGSAKSLFVVCGISQREFVVAVDEIVGLLDLATDEIVWSDPREHGLTADGIVVIEGRCLVENLRLF